MIPPCKILPHSIRLQLHKSALAWALQQDFAVIPSSTKREHLIANLAAQEIQLTKDEMSVIAQLDRHAREISPEQLAPALGLK